MNLGSGFWACWYRGQKIIFITYWRLPLTYLLIVFFLRYACAIPIPENDTVILTGGYTTRRTVAVYNENGWQRNLPNLLTERMYLHGCTSFVSRNKRVDIFYKFYMGCITFILWLFQILLVSGGAVGGHYRDQSEVYEGGNSWVQVANLPWKLSQFTIINIDNKILLFGKHIWEKDLLKVV